MLYSLGIIGLKHITIYYSKSVVGTDSKCTWFFGKLIPIRLSLKGCLTEAAKTKYCCMGQRWGKYCF